jgi:hypothetical protein
MPGEGASLHWSSWQGSKAQVELCVVLKGMLSILHQDWEMLQLKLMKDSDSTSGLLAVGRWVAVLLVDWMVNFGMVEEKHCMEPLSQLRWPSSAVDLLRTLLKEHRDCTVGKRVVLEMAFCALPRPCLKAAESGPGKLEE